MYEKAHTVVHYTLFLVEIACLIYFRKHITIIEQDFAIGFNNLCVHKNTMINDEIFVYYLFINIIIIPALIHKNLSAYVSKVLKSRTF